MFIIPYYIETKQLENFKITKAWIFMAKGGTKYWETEEPTLTKAQVIQSYLQPNGIYGTVKCVKGNTLYFQVDQSSTKLADFYTWTDFLDKGQPIPHELDVWRPFLWVCDTNVEPSRKDIWGWDEEVKDMAIQKFWEAVCS